MTRLDLDPNPDSAGFRAFCAFRGHDPQTEAAADAWVALCPATRAKWRRAARAAAVPEDPPRRRRPVIPAEQPQEIAP